jgi:endonuclease I/fibronectin type 3 domain-containing protein
MGHRWLPQILEVRSVQRSAIIAAVLLSLTACVDETPTAPGIPDLAPQASLLPPAGYYSSVDASSAATLRPTLHDVIDDHTRFPYTSTATDTWDILELAQEDPNDPGRIIDVYLNASYLKAGGGNTDYNREHAWPKSYGFPSDYAAADSANMPYTDAHALFLSNDSYNSSRNNKPFRWCGPPCEERPTEFNDGRGGGTGLYPGNSNWTIGGTSDGSWEVWPGRRGDIARALLYLDVRYEGGTHSSSSWEPDLILTDDPSLIQVTSGNVTDAGPDGVAYMGLLSVLLAWHEEDPVDDRERNRNAVIFSFQGNRNPFVDHPEWVGCVFSGACSGGGDDTEAPVMLDAVSAEAGDGVVHLSWSASPSSDLGGYSVYRSESGGASWTRLTPALLQAVEYDDASVVNGTTYSYAVSATDVTGNESALTSPVTATPGAGPTATPWINEFHYDNKGGDQGEFVEIAGLAGTDVSGWTVVGYNGSGGTVYGSVALTGSIPDQAAGFGTRWVDFPGLQNGSPDGIALVDATGTVVDFIAYEGSLTATAGPASGMTAVDIGVSESGNDRGGRSLQLVGTGGEGNAFTWQPPAPASPGQPNDGQTFSGNGGGDGGEDSTPPAVPEGLTAVGGDAVVDLNWADVSNPDLAGYHVYRWTSTDPTPARQTVEPLAQSRWSDATVANGMSYSYSVTAIDTSGNESEASAEASATPTPAPEPGVVHISSIVAELSAAGGRNSQTLATVSVVDESGQGVQGLSVSVNFSGGVSGTGASLTDANGIAVIQGPKRKGTFSFTACVDSVSGAGWTYDPGSNAVTCSSGSP